MLCHYIDVMFDACSVSVKAAVTLAEVIVDVFGSLNSRVLFTLN